MQIKSISKSFIAAIAMLSLGATVHQSVSAASATPATSATQNLVINATVTRSCTFDTITPVSLAYDELANGANGPSPAAPATLNYTCGFGSAPTMSFGGGANSGKNTGSGLRALANGGALLGYKLVDESASKTSGCPTDASGVDIGINSAILLPSGTGSAQSFPVCVEVANGQHPGAGKYSDTVVVTLTF